MTVLDFYKVINDEVNVELYNKDDDINYFYGHASDIPVKYLDFCIRHITATCNVESEGIDYLLCV